MEKTAKIVRSEFKNEWAGPKGTVFYHDIEFDNGDKGSIGTKDKSPEKISIGKELTYTLADGKIKAVQPQNNGQTYSGGAKGKAPQDEAAKVASMLISYGHDMVIAGKSTTLAAAVKEIEDSFNGLYDRLKLKMQC